MKPIYTEDDFQQALLTLQQGGVILYPTDTIWGLGCDATNIAAIERIYAIKQRNNSLNLLLLMSDEWMLRRYVSNIPEVAFQLLEVSDVQPISIIYPATKGLPAELLAPDGSIGVRLPNDTFCQSLIRKLGKPITSTSANISGTPSPQTFADVAPELRHSVDYIVRWRQNDTRPAAASSIIKVEADNSFRIIRK